METIDVTPTWEGWLNMAKLIIYNAKPAKRQEALDTLWPDFQNMAKLATMKTAEIKAAEEGKYSVIFLPSSENQNLVNHMNFQQLNAEIEKNNDWIKVDGEEFENTAIYRKDFNTEPEMNAYIEGYQEAIGYMGDGAYIRQE